MALKTAAKMVCGRAASTRAAPASQAHRPHLFQERDCFSLAGLDDSHRPMCSKESERGWMTPGKEMSPLAVR
jgi:hypothetical protein